MAKKQPVLTPEAQAKRWLRRYLTLQRKRIAPAAARRLSARLTRAFVSSSYYKSAKTVALFVSFGSEVQTRAIIEDAWRRGKTVLIPMTSRGFHRPFFAVYTPETKLIQTSRGPWEAAGTVRPVDAKRIDLIAVPGLGFDARGHRLGYGGGVYDRLLALTPKAVHVGLFYEAQRLDHLPREAHDHPLKGIVTEAGFLVVGAAPALRSARQ